MPVLEAGRVAGILGKDGRKSLRIVTRRCPLGIVVQMLRTSLPFDRMPDEIMVKTWEPHFPHCLPCFETSQKWQGSFRLATQSAQ